MTTLAAVRKPDFSRSRRTRWAMMFTLALLIAIGVNHAVWAIAQWPMGDLAIYLGAAERIRAGEPLYAVAEPYMTFWYAPWFAVAFVPLTFLPQPVVAVAWSATLLAATFGVGWMLWRMDGAAAKFLALMAVPALFAVSAGGNVQPLMVLGLLIGLRRPSGPLWIAIAASLKFTPILFVFVYLARRDWRRSAVTLLLAGALVGPALLLGLPIGRATDWAESAPSLLAWGPWTYGAVVGAACLMALIGPKRFAPLAAASAAVLALPRLFVYDITLIAAAAALPPDEAMDGSRGDP